MNHLSEAEAIQTLERSLRRLIEHEMEAHYGPGWLTVAGAMKVGRRTLLEKLEHGAENEVARRASRGVLRVDPVGLAYADLGDLTRLIEIHWGLFEEALKHQNETLVLLGRVDRILRNPASHGRPLLEFERDLLAGVAGQIANLVTIHMSSTDESGDYYPVIDRVADSYNNEVVNLDPNHLFHECRTNVVLKPDMRVAYECVGTDPQGRPLQWQLTLPAGGPLVVAEGRSGQPVRLEWMVRNEDVRVHATVHVRVLAIGTEFHRFGTYDQRVYFRYRVDPP